MLHLFLLWPAALPDRQGETASLLSVVLLPGKSRVPAAISIPSSPDRAAAHSDGANLLVAREDAPRVLQSPNTPPQSNTLASTTEKPLRSDSPPAGMAVAAREAVPQVVAATDGAGLDADGVRQYRMALALEARRFKRYPPSALAEDVGGTVEVRVSVAAGGQAQEIALARTSGYSALDDAALDMLRKAAPRTVVPELLRRRSFVINLPVVFDVANE